MVASDNARLGTAVDARTERYRRAERAFWDYFGLAPVERFVDVGSPPVRLRVQELGSGEPVLFVNGTGGPVPIAPARPWMSSASTRSMPWAAQSGASGCSGWPRPTRLEWNVWSFWAAGR